MQTSFIDKALELFQNQKYFECHEVLEDLWRPLRPGNEKLFLQGWIQLAVGMHHWQNHNLIGTRNKLKEGLQKLESLDSIFSPPTDLNAIRQECRNVLSETEKSLIIPN